MSDNEKKPVSWWQVMLSTLMSFFGVQKSDVHERDFEKGSPIRFIIMGVVLTILFVLTLVMIVKIVLSSAGV